MLSSHDKILEVFLFFCFPAASLVCSKHFPALTNRVSKYHILFIFTPVVIRECCGDLCFLQYPIVSCFHCSSVTLSINICIESSTVTYQRKPASICPVPNTAAPHEKSYYRPISVTSVLSRIFQCNVVRDYVYPDVYQLFFSLLLVYLSFCQWRRGIK